MSKTPEHRYHISCDTCGLLDTRKTKWEAYEYAKSQKEKHESCGKLISVYDSMAHYKGMATHYV